MTKISSLSKFELHERPSRVVIDKIAPQIDAGRFAVKRYLDEEVEIRVSLLVDGHDLPKGRVFICGPGDGAQETRDTQGKSENKAAKVLPLVFKINDEWIAKFKPDQLGLYTFYVEAALDRFGTWRSDVLKKLATEQNILVDLKSGLLLMEAWLEKVGAHEKKILQATTIQLKKMTEGKISPKLAELRALVQDPVLEEIAHGIFDAASRVRSEGEIPLRIEPVHARFSSWYEFFPRSTARASKTPKHGTFKEAEGRLEYIQKMGFDIVYFPPIHPIGSAFRKGKNNSLKAEATDVGSPWAIGAQTGGHRDILPDLGSFADFDKLVKKAQSLKMDIALDLAFQCSPDHPYVQEHPQWFKQRPDGTIQYAENPPKKYQDIYPFDFESVDWRNLWTELREVVRFWISKGVRVFRVDNPHTKALHFWEWLIASVKEESPDVIFLAEAFTRPKIMAYLAKSGFSQSYTYFTWKNLKWELTQYLNELTQTELSDYFQPNFWPNTPDILPEPLHIPHRGLYMQRLILAATLSSSYGIYGPVYELMEHKPREKGSEEYLDSEKYQLRNWNLDKPDSLAGFIERINEIRREHKSLQQNRTLKLHTVANENLFAFSKTFADEKILVVVNLDPHNVQSGMVEIPLTEWKLSPDQNFAVHDLLTDAKYVWHGWQNFVQLCPEAPAHIFRIEPHTEKV